MADAAAGRMQAGAGGGVAAPSPRLRRTIASEDAGHMFDGTVTLAQLGDVRLCRIDARSHADGKPRRFTGGNQSPFFKLVFQLGGTCHLEQDERRTVLSAGDWAVYDVSRGYRMQNVSDLDQLVLLLPHGDTSRALARMVRAAPNRAFRSDGLSRVLRTASQTALDEAEGVGSTGSIGLGQTLAELASLAVTQQMDAAPRITAAETVRDRIARTVLRNLRDPDLSIDTIAARLRYSKRYLHKAFSGDGQTLAQFIWSARLERCERDLIDPRLAERSITEIAFGWGFVNSAHFSRSFRARYGMAPREHREQAARAA